MNITYHMISREALQKLQTEGWVISQSRVESSKWDAPMVSQEWISHPTGGSKEGALRTYVLLKNVHEDSACELLADCIACMITTPLVFIGSMIGTAGCCLLESCQFNPNNPHAEEFTKTNQCFTKSCYWGAKFLNTPPVYQRVALEGSWDLKKGGPFLQTAQPTDRSSLL